jgi:hypothetical protein
MLWLEGPHLRPRAGGWEDEVQGPLCSLPVGGVCVVARASGDVTEGEGDMREDHLEALEQMFPSGFLIMYTCPDGQIRYSMWNPLKNECINDWLTQLREASENGPQSYWRTPDGT